MALGAGDGAEHPKKVTTEIERFGGLTPPTSTVILFLLLHSLHTLHLQ